MALRSIAPPGRRWRHRDLHLSAQGNLALAAKLGPGGQPIDLLYINRLDSSGKRDIEPNR
jgi:hypothetical protein